MEFLPKETGDRIASLEPADIIGIPSYNNARTIGHVVRAVSAGLMKHFPNNQAVLVNSDGGSTDGTPEAVQGASGPDCRALLIAHPLHPVHRVITPYHGIPGKGSAIRTIMQIAGVLQAKSCVVVDADLRSITPEWVELLVSPVLREGFDFVAPLYHRHKYDGTITNSIIYPLTRALYGRRVRQPIGGDFGFSGRLARYYLAQDVWHTDVARFGIDIWMTTSAIANGYKVCQAFLGAKIHDAKDPSADLSAMFTQVIGSVFSLMETHRDQWTERMGSESVPLFGFEHAVGLEPVPVNLERMIGRFRSSVQDLAELWSHILEPEALAGVLALSRLSAVEFHYPAELWVRTVYGFSLAYHGPTMNRDHLLQALLPLYLARTASFVRETASASPEEVEANMEELCRCYEAGKPELVRRWKAKGGK